MGRTLDVYGLQEVSDEPDPHANLPFISHHELNLWRGKIGKVCAGIKIITYFLQTVSIKIMTKT